MSSHLAASISKKNRIGLLALLGLWAGWVLLTLSTRPPLPIDETRYLSVAWQMLQRNDFWVPYLNDHPYSHKPPLLFWLICIVWKFFGADGYCGRLVAPLFGLGNILLTTRFFRMLWPNSPHPSYFAGLCLISFLPFQIYLPMTMFDNLVEFFTILGLIGILEAWRGKSVLPWALTGASVTLGILAKGPVILVFLIPVILLLPWINPSPRSKSRWYLSGILTLTLGSALVLVWAIPAAIKGGPEYSKAIFLTQTAGRLVHAFDHAHPFWWYLALSPVILFPWFFWIPAWRSFAQLPRQMDFGSRFCLIWIVPAFVILSLISGKQIHYLAPMFPAIALLATHTLLNLGNVQRRGSQKSIAITFMVLGGLIILLYNLLGWKVKQIGLPPDTQFLGVLVILTGVALFFTQFKNMVQSIHIISLASLALMVFTHLISIDFIKDRYDLRPISEKIKQFQMEGKTVAYFTRYSGEFNYLGRLEKTIHRIRGKKLQPWPTQNPKDVVIVRCRVPLSIFSESPQFWQKFKKDIYAIWSSKSIVADPTIGAKC
ncbi:MAG: ArnT family glycosyltransferase [Nitrospinales bacterium]